MSKCKDIRQLISRYCDGDCKGEDLFHMAHVDHCASCRKVLAEYVSLKDLVSESFSGVQGMESRTRFIRKTSTTGKRKTTASLFSMRIAALFVGAVAITGIFVAMHGNAKKNMPLVYTENAIVKLKNIPLGSLVYYQEYALSGVHVQETSSLSASSSDASNAIASFASSYISPLFNDTSVVSNRYNTIVMLGL